MIGPSRDTNIIQQFFIYIILAILIFALDGTRIFTLPKTIVEQGVVTLASIERPVIQLVSRPFESLKSGRKATLKIRNLEDRLAEALVDSARLQQLEQENQDMRKLLEAPLSPSWDYYVAPVLSRNQSILTVGVGKRDGIQTTHTAVYEENLVGSISEASERISQLKTILHPNTNIRARISSSTTDGIVRSEDSKLYLTEILQNAQVEPGEIVVTAGSDNYLPDIVIGTISLVEQDTDGVHQRAEITPAVDPNSLSNVFIIQQ